MIENSLKQMQFVIFIQARLSSTRYPGKMLEPLWSEMTLLEYVYHRCSTSTNANKVVVITSDETSDDPLALYCQRLDFPLFRGPLNDVLGRFVQAADVTPSAFIVRVCGDSPFVDINAMDKLIDKVIAENVDYGIVTDCMDGFTSEVISAETLRAIDAKATSEDEREHVTTYIHNHLDSFNTVDFQAGTRPEGELGYKMTVDYPEDMVVARKIASGLNDFYFTAEDAISRIIKAD